MQCVVRLTNKAVPRNRFHRLLCYNTGVVECWIAWPKVPFTPGGSQELRVPERAFQEPRVMENEDRREQVRQAHQTARQSCGELLDLSQLPVCLAHGAHKVSKARRDRPEYHFFAAVSQGCLTCVRHELEEKCQVNPDVVSESNGYSARDFAAYAVDQRVKGAAAVQEYLEAHWSHLPVKAR